MNFASIDWIILVLYLGITVFVGIWVKRYVEDLSGYVVAGRRVKVSLGVATFAATEMGIITFMYFGELGYVAGFSAFIIGILAMVAYMAVGKTGFIISDLRQLGMMTIPEFYEKRFSKRVRLVGGVILFTGGVLNMGIFLKFDGIFLTEVMGFGPEALTFTMVLMMVIVLSYTILGGMFSVVITDFMQFVILSFSMFVATASVLLQIDISVMESTVQQVHGNGGFNPIENERFGWMFIFWVLISNVAASALWQPGTSKALSSESPAVARKVFWITGMTFAGRAMIPMIWGVAALAYFGTGLDPVTAMPKLLGAVVPVGFLGLLVAGMLAASMSTYSSYLLAWSSVLTLDVINYFKPGGLSDRSKIFYTRLVAGFIGIFLLVFGLFYQIPDTAFQYLFITGAMYTAGALGCVTAGLYWKKANTVGAYGALLLGALAPLCFLLLQGYSESLPESIGFITNVNVSGVLSFFLAGGGMVVGSLLTQHSSPPRPIIIERNS